MIHMTVCQSMGDCSPHVWILIIQVQLMSFIVFTDNSRMSGKVTQQRSVWEEDIRWMIMQHMLVNRLLQVSSTSTIRRRLDIFMIISQVLDLSDESFLTSDMQKF